MTADFLDLLCNHGYDGVLVMLGIDEHRYVLFAQNVFEKMLQDDMFKQGIIAAIYSPMIKGFYGYPKMSKSFPESSINTETSKDEIIERLMNGEGDYVNPYDNVVFQIMTQVGGYSTQELKERFVACKEKNQKWIMYKKECAERISEIFSLWE